MKIVNLVDDLDSNNNLLNEHGLSFYIEADEKKYLFDTGASEKFLRNANRLGISIKDVDALFISHNHYDHIGGLSYFMETNKKAKIYIKEDSVFSTFYERGHIKCPLGKFHKELAESDRVVFVKDSMKVDNFHLMTDTNGNKDYFCQGTKFLMDRDGKIIPDEFTHEMFLVYIDNDTASILSACSHRGIINIIETTKKAFGMPVNNVIAGLHLAANGGKDINCSEEYYNSLVNYLKGSDVGFVETCHCTGKYAYDLLKRDLKDKVNYFSMGIHIII